MRRIAFAAVLAPLALAGCAIVDHGDELPSAKTEADARYYDPWGGYETPILVEEER